ncbi:MAG: hypothetical protein DRP88_04030 [Candidatus Neomarinimicrobiota bacterium]|nr:MAG: hypothetical protein DRP88_04030 [Candidatus Neomarinimicrobiota bacterium]
MFLKALYDTIMITVFVFAMMLVIEYINVQTRGKWEKIIGRRRFGQYLVGALLGAVPGCLGSFTAVALYSHNILSLGALVTTMIATMGDETFVIMAMAPRKALLVITALFFISIPFGWLTDLLIGKRANKFFKCECMEVHGEHCECFKREYVIPQLKQLSLERFLLLLISIVSILLVVFGVIGPEKWNWVRITILFVLFVATFIILTVPDHFLKEHMWEHVLKNHIPKIILWTFGALILVELIVNRLNLDSWIQSSKLIVLLIACLVGLIPESGPHLIFVTLYVSGTIPLSILLASSIVQDGHGALPLLAHSRKIFLLVKLINFIAGISVGGILLLNGL